MLLSSVARSHHQNPIRLQRNHMRAFHNGYQTQHIPAHEFCSTVGRAQSTARLVLSGMGTRCAMQPLGCLRAAYASQTAAVRTKPTTRAYLSYEPVCAIK